MIQELEHVSVGAGLLLNSLLLYIIRRFSRAELGTYKYLLAIFAAFDIFLSLLHYALNPKMIRVGLMFAAVLHTWVETAYLSSLYFTCFSMPFALLNIHFLYRYLVIKHPTLIQHLSSPKYIAGIAAYPIVQATVCCLLIFHIFMFFGSLSQAPAPGDPVLPLVREAFRNIYNDTVVDGWLIMDYWRDGHFNTSTLTAIFPAIVIITATFSVATYLVWGTFQGIAKAHGLSEKHRDFQLWILYAACAQTVVPLVFVYIPYFCVIYFPFIGIPDYGIAYIFPLLVSLFPAWDAVIITLLIRDYRIGLLQMLGLRKQAQLEVNAKEKDMTTTTWAQPRTAIES